MSAIAAGGRLAEDCGLRGRQRGYLELELDAEVASEGQRVNHTDGAVGCIDVLPVGVRQCATCDELEDSISLDILLAPVRCRNRVFFGVVDAVVVTVGIGWVQTEVLLFDVGQAVAILITIDVRRGARASVFLLGIGSREILIVVDESIAVVVAVLAFRAGVIGQQLVEVLILPDVRYAVVVDVTSIDKRAVILSVVNGCNLVVEHCGIQPVVPPVILRAHIAVSRIAVQLGGGVAASQIDVVEAVVGNQVVFGAAKLARHGVPDLLGLADCTPDADIVNRALEAIAAQDGRDNARTALLQLMRQGCANHVLAVDVQLDGHGLGIVGDRDVRPFVAVDGPRACLCLGVTKVVGDGDAGLALIQPQPIIIYRIGGIHGAEHALQDGSGGILGDLHVGLDGPVGLEREA